MLLVLVAGSYFLGAALCWTLPSYNPRIGGAHPAEAVGEAGSAVRETFSQLADGVRFILANRTIFWPLTYLALTASLIGVLGVLGPAFATQVLGLSERDFVVVVLPLGVGLVMGILVLNIYGRLMSRRRGIELGLIGLGITLLALSIAQPLTQTLSLSISLLSIVIVVAFAAGVCLRLRRRAGADPAPGGAAARRPRPRLRRPEHARQHRQLPADHHRRADRRLARHVARRAGRGDHRASRRRRFDPA